MQELNEKELEQVVGGAAWGTTDGGAGGYGATYGPGYSFSNSGSNSTIQPSLIQTTAANQSGAAGWNSTAGSSAATYSSGTVY